MEFNQNTALMTNIMFPKEVSFLSGAKIVIYTRKVREIIVTISNRDTINFKECDHDLYYFDTVLNTMNG